MRKFRFKGAPYLRSTDLIDEFRKEAKTPEQQQLITDLFERITLYDLKVTDAATRKAGDGWTTTLTVAADKYYASGKGAETKAKLAEPIEVGLFTARPGLGAFSAKDVIVMEREPIRSGAQRIMLNSKRKPAFAGVDPYNFYVDRNSDDNVRTVDEAEADGPRCRRRPLRGRPRPVPGGAVERRFGQARHLPSG